MITLKALKLRNFLSHIETDVVFEDNQKLLIEGNSGSGKSSVLEGIIWALYGEGRTSNASLIRRGETKAEVSLNLGDGEHIYHISRSISGSKHTLAIQIDGVAHPMTGVRDLQNWIETELTGASYLLFVNSVAYVQGNPDSFVTQSATKRKDLLLEIIKTIDFDDYYEKTKTKISQEEKELAAHEQSATLSNAWLTESKEKIKIKGKLDDSIIASDLEFELALREREISVVTISKVEERVKAINRIKTEIVEVKDIETRAIDQKARLEKEVAGLAMAQSVVLPDKKTTEEAVSLLTTEITQVNNRISEAATINATRIDMLSSKPADMGWANKAEEANKVLSDPHNQNKCSNNDCPYFKEGVVKLVQYAVLYAEYLEKQRAFEVELSNWGSAYEALPVIDVSSLRTELQTLTTTLSIRQRDLNAINQLETNRLLIEQYGLKCVELTENIAVTSKKLAGLGIELLASAAGVDEVELAWHRSKIAICDSELTSINRERSANQHLMGYIIETESKIPAGEQALSDTYKLIELTKHNIYRLDLLKDAFGSKGLKSIVIDYILPELEEKINDILAQMSDFRVALDTQQEKADGEGNKEGLFITIINDMGEEMPFESYSGGERLKIIVSITEALATLQRCGFRLFDETFIGLDENSLESFVKVLDNLLERFPQVVCVSHLAEIKASFEDRIVVTKNNGVSYV